MDAWTESPPADWFLAAEHKYTPSSKGDNDNKVDALATPNWSSWDRAIKNTFDMCQQLGI